MFKPLKTVDGSIDITADTINTEFISTVTSTGGGGAIQPQLTVYTSGSGTYTTPVGAKYLIVECIGGGGGGAGNGTANASYGGGGGGGGYYLKQFNNPDASYSYTVGTGGTGTPAGSYADGSNGTASTFGGMSAGGGGGGKRGSTSVRNGDGGPGGSTFTGLVSEIIKINGGNGGTGQRFGGVAKISAFGGGAGHTGFGKTTENVVFNGAGAEGPLYGAGGGGSTGEPAVNNGVDGKPGRISVLAYF